MSLFRKANASSFSTGLRFGSCACMCFRSWILFDIAIRICVGGTRKMKEGGTLNVELISGCESEDIEQVLPVPMGERKFRSLFVGTDRADEHV